MSEEKKDAEFPSVARSDVGEPAAVLAQRIREKYRTIASKNREDTIQKTLEKSTDERLTRYDSSLVVDARQYVPDYMEYVHRLSGYVFGRPYTFPVPPNWDGEDFSKLSRFDPLGEISLMQIFEEDFDTTLIPKGGVREKLFFQAIAGDESKQDATDVLRGLVRNSGSKEGK